MAPRGFELVENEDENLPEAERRTKEFITGKWGLDIEGMEQCGVDVAVDELGASLRRWGLDYTGAPEQRLQVATLAPFILYVEVAWADGEIQAAERRLIDRALRDIPSMAVRSVVGNLLQTRPDDAVLDAGRRLTACLLLGIGDSEKILDSPVPVFAKRIAQAAGGIFNAGVIDANEKETLGKFYEDLEEANSLGSETSRTVLLPRVRHH